MSRYTWWLCCLLLLSAPLVHAEEQPVGTMLSLDTAVAMALANNPALVESLERLASGQENAKAVRADTLPKLSTSYSYLGTEDAPYVNFNGNRAVVDSRDNFAWDLKITQPLFTGFALSAKIKMAELGVDIRKVEHQLVTLELIEQTKFSYYEILRQRQFLRVAEETVAQLTAHVADAGHFYDQALIPYNDLLKSRVALNNAQQRRLQVQSNLEMAGAHFNTLLKLPLDQTPEIADLQSSPGVLPDLDHLQKASLADRPEIRALQLAMENSDQQVRLAQSSYYPEVDLEGRYVRNGDNPTASNNDYANDHNASVGLKATWTFFEWGKQRALVSKEVHEHGVLAAQLETLRDTIRLEVKQSWLHLKVAAANIRTVESARNQAEENYRITRLQYRQNLATSSDVLDAQTMLSEAEGNACNSRYDYLRAEAEVDRAIGHQGGKKKNL